MPLTLPLIGEIQTLGVPRNDRLADDTDTSEGGTWSESRGHRSSGTGSAGGEQD